MTQERRFQARLEQGFKARRERNPRYSLRAFAAFMGADHSTLSQIRVWAKKLGMDSEETTAYLTAEHVQLRHWTAQAMSIVTEPAHWEINWEILRLSRTSGFQADCPWIAGQIKVALARVRERVFAVT